jgi:hypothetical protein
MLVGHDEHMCRRLGADIAKGGHLLILMEDIGFGLTSHNPAKDPICGHG